MVTTIAMLGFALLGFPAQAPEGASAAKPKGSGALLGGLLPPTVSGMSGVGPSCLPVTGAHWLCSRWIIRWYSGRNASEMARGRLGGRAWLGHELLLQDMRVVIGLCAAMARMASGPYGEVQSKGHCHGGGEGNCSKQGPSRLASAAVQPPCEPMLEQGGDPLYCRSQGMT